MESFKPNLKFVSVVSLLLALFIWATPWQTQDGPNHKKVAVILSRLANSPAEREVYRSHLGPFTTNSLFPLAYQGLSKFFSPGGYEKLFVGLFLILLLFSYRFFLATWSPENLYLWVLVLPLCFHPLFIRGMYNFLASVPLTLIALSLMRRGLERPKWIYLAAFALCAYLAFLAHPFPFFVLPVCLVILTLGTYRDRPAWSAGYATVIFIFLFLGFLVPFFRTTRQEALNPYSFKPLLELLGGFFAYNFTGYSVLQMVLLIPFLLVLLALMGFSLKTSPWRQKSYWICFLMLYFLFPDEGKGGAHLNQRFLPFVWMFLPLGLKISIPRIKWIQWVTILTGLYLAVSVQWGMRKVQGTVQDAQWVLKGLPNQSRLYPMLFDLHGPGLTYNSLRHLWAVYDPHKVEFSPYLFSFMELMPLARKRPSSPTYFPATAENLAERISRKEICRVTDPVQTPDCRRERKEALQNLLLSGSYYDYWFLYRPPADFLKILDSDPGLRKISERSGVSLWRNDHAKPFSPPL